jgi:signal transduction histidine kinase
MKIRFRSASRLSIVFILALAISGGLLTYFSINTISNFKELTEKKVQEEEAQLAQWFLESIQQNTDRATSLFLNKSDLTGFGAESLLEIESSDSLIRFPFVLEKEGTFLFPNFPEKLPPKDLKQSSAGFLKNYSLGETAEFLKSDYETAFHDYFNNFKEANSNNDKAHLLNALGRVSVKRSQNTSAFGYYKSVVSNYFSEVDKNGFPFVYYAIPQLVKISNSFNSDSLLTLINSFLSKLKYGEIPLNFSTEEILQQVSVWLAQNNFRNTEAKHIAEDFIWQVNKQTAFIQNYGEIIKGNLLERNGQTGADSSGFKPVNVPSRENNLLFLMNTGLKNPAGFAIKGDTLFTSILKEVKPSEFEYRFEISEWKNSSITNNGLIFYSQLNPYFPKHQIQIKLANENLIDDYVLRQSWIYGILLILLIAGMTLGVILILRDISREKQIARLRADFISNVTHELKTPLTSILMFAESLFLGRIKSDSDKKEYYSLIIKESGRLKRMINNILEFSKMEKGKAEYRFILVNLSELINSVIQEMNYWLEEKNFEVQTELDKTIAAEIDPEKMKQTLENLLSNAVKYSDENRKIFIRLFFENNQACIEIEDFGIGIAPNHLDHIFEKFYRASQNEIAEISGTGLGLTVVKEIVEAHRGEIKVSSEVGKGSKFSVILKLSQTK